MKQEKLKVYIESSVISMYFQENAPYLRDITRRFWEEVLPYFDTYISEIVLDEIRATKDTKLRKKMENLIKNFKVLEVNEDILNLADIYLSKRHLPRMDALHLASASLGEIQFLVTWNLKHLYKRGTQEMIREVNLWLKIPIPTVATPEDFFGEEV
jgi:predicted nucleic acid-binding protein